jgi:photosystem II stability/assembly factor-like uncharacterized protein
MNEETRLLEVDRMIDEITAVPPGTGRAHAATHVSPSPDRIVVNELRGLGMIDWPADEVGDQIAHAVADTIRYPESEPATEPRHQARLRPLLRRRLGRSVAASVAVAAAVILLVVVPRTNGPSGSGRHGASGPVSVASLKMHLVDSTTSPFQSVGSGPQSGDLVCVTATVCYADATGGVSGVERTTDGGVTWQATAALPDHEQFAGGPLSCPTTEVCVGAASADGPAGAGGPGLLQLTVTTDGGRSWSIESLNAPSGMSGAAIDQVSCATATQCVVHVLGQSGSAAAEAGTFLFSTDGGATWTAASSVPSAEGTVGLFTLRCDPDGGCIGLAPADAAPPPATGAMDALRSTDGGRTWTVTSVPLAVGEGVILMSCGDTLHCMMAYPSPSGGAITLATTADGGATWRVTPAPSTWPTIAVSVSCATAQDCFISAASSTSHGGYENPVIEATHDGGTTWAPLALPEVDGSSLALVYPLSCPVGDGCIGVGATPQEFDGPATVPVTLPERGWVSDGQRVIISNLPETGGSSSRARS